MSEARRSPDTGSRGRGRSLPTRRSLPRPTMRMPWLRRSSGSREDWRQSRSDASGSVRQGWSIGPARSASRRTSRGANWIFGPRWRTRSPCLRTWTTTATWRHGGVPDRRGPRRRPHAPRCPGDGDRRRHRGGRSVAPRRARVRGRDRSHHRRARWSGVRVWQPRLLGTGRVRHRDPAGGAAGRAGAPSEHACGPRRGRCGVDHGTRRHASRA